MNERNEKSLLTNLIERDLTALNQQADVPEGFTAQWRARLEEGKMDRPVRKKVIGKWLATAAAAVFVLGGTWLARDLAQLNPQQGIPNAGEETGAVNYSNDMSKSGLYMYGDDYEMASDDLMEQVILSANNMPESKETSNNIQMRIRKVNLTLTTLDFEDDIAKIEALVDAYDGYTEYQYVTPSIKGLRNANMDLRIPADSLDDFIDEAKAVGIVESISMRENDVSESYQDTQTRLLAQRTKMERLLALITDAQDLTAVVMLENEIANTQYQIDTLESQLRSTESKVAYSSVSMTINEEKEEVALANPKLTLGQRITEGLRATFDSITVFLRDMLVFTVASLPFVAIVVVVYAAVRIGHVIHKKKKNKEENL